jgi:hypothetical protein
MERTAPDGRGARAGSAPPLVPEVPGRLRRHFVRLPEAIREAPGIRVLNRHVRSVLFSTDVAVIRNTDADAVIAVYPFTPQPIITRALIEASDVPVFCGVGGGVTSGARTLAVALDADFQGAHAVVVNAPTPNDLVSELKRHVEVPVIVTVASARDDIRARVEAGADILNVSGAQDTPDIVRLIRDLAPEVPVIGTGGPTDETIRAVLNAGAHAVTFTPPTTAHLFRGIMERYRTDR